MNQSWAKSHLLGLKSVLDAINVPFFLTHGTLLGAIRENDFIEYDHDIDLAMMATDWFPGICSHLRKEGFSCKAVERHPPWITKLSLGRNHVRTDLVFQYHYPLENTHVCLALRPEERIVLTPSPFFEGDCFIDFLGESFRVLNPPEDYLLYYYGDTWRSPMHRPKDTPPLEYPWKKHWSGHIPIEKYLDYIAVAYADQVNQRKRGAFESQTSSSGLATT